MATTITNPLVRSKNYFKNPNFAVIQGTASGNVPSNGGYPTSSLGYPGETGWFLVNVQAGAPTYAFSSTNESVTITGEASSNGIYFGQRLESADTVQLKGKTVTFSFETSNSLLTTILWIVSYPNTNNSHGSVNTPTQTIIAGGTITVSSTLTRYSATVNLPTQVGLGLEIKLVALEQTSGTWVVSRLQLEEGATATAFNCGDYGEELRKCQRYFQISPIGWALTTNSAATYMGVSGTLPVGMRTTPIVTQLTTDVYGIHVGPGGGSGDFNSTNSAIDLVNASASGVARIRLTGLGATPHVNTFYSLLTEGKFSFSAHIP